MRSRHAAHLATVAFVRNGDDVLLLRHPRDGARFAGLWNGVGGHVEQGEDVRGAARRELREEAGLDVPGLRLRGVVHEQGLLAASYLVFFFVGEARARALRPAAGHELAWQPLARLAELPLVPDVAQLVPRLFSAREPVFATETFDGRDGLVQLAFDEAGA